MVTSSTQSTKMGENNNSTPNSNNNNNRNPFVIGVAGGTSSGKSSVCTKIMEALGQNDVSDSQRKVVCIAQDSFYKELNDADAKKASKGCYDFDHPNAIDQELIMKTLKNVLAGEKTTVPVYDYSTSKRKAGQFLTIYPADVVLFEGILAFYVPEIRNLFHMKLFVDTDPDTRLARRVLRDVNERGRDLETILTQYTHFVKPAFEEFCLPTKKFADVIIPRGADNKVAISLIVQHIKDILKSDTTKSHDHYYALPCPNVVNRFKTSEVSKRPH